jgi:osmoprotectant transport system ATP-binding protein
VSDTTDTTTRPNAESSDAAGVPIVLDHVSKRYTGTKGAAVDDISLEIPAGEIVILVGPSGCGKTTTMRMINRLIEPTAGKVTIDGEDVLSLDDVKLRREIGYVIQQIGLFPHLSIAQNIALVPRMLRWGKTRVNERVDEMLMLVGLDPEEYRHRFPRQLSGGQQQRVGVARALAADPPVMLMDEPFGAVDPINRARLQDEFLAVQEKLRKTIVFVTHDFDEAIKMGDRIAILEQGAKIAQYATPEEILSSPANDFVESFVGQGATLKRLQLERLEALELHPVSAASTSASRVSIKATLHDVLDEMIATAQESLVVVRDDQPIGSVSLDDVLARVRELRAEAEASEGSPT